MKMDSEKYAKFDVSEVTYKVVNEQDIKAYILTPKGLSPGKYPIVAKFHGGAFATGASLYTDWYPQWALDYCLFHSAIIVTGDYRLIPESTGTDMYEDVLSFWDWVRHGLQSSLDDSRPGVLADLSKVIVHGESAGGTLSILSGFSQPKGFIKAVIAMYPMTDFNPKREKTPFGMPIPPISVLETLLKSMKPGKIVTAAYPPERLDIAFAISLHGKKGEFYGNDPKTYPKMALEAATDIPYTLLLHGTEDSVVPVAGSIEWKDAVVKKFGDGKLDLQLKTGEHGFDCDVPLNTAWLQEALAPVTELWLGKER